MLDPLPRVALVPGLGLFGLGRSKKDARVAADLAEVRDRDHHRRRSDRPLRVDLAKPTCSTWNTGRSSRPSSARAKECRSPARSRSITGAAGAIGAATAKAFAAAGAEVALLDLDEAGAHAQGQGDRRRGARGRAAT